MVAGSDMARDLHVKETSSDLPLWTADFRLFFAARTTSLLGDAMLPVAITAAVIRAGYGASGVGYALAALVAPFAALIIFGGVLSDRLGARRLMVVSDMARLCFQAVLALLFLLGTPQLWQILVLLALVGAGSAIFQPGVASITPRIAQDVQKANATLRISESVTGVIGPSLAGLLLVVSSPATVVALDALTYGISGACLLLLRSVPMGPDAREGASSFRSDLVEGWREFRARTWLWSVIVVFMLWQLAGAGPIMTLGNSTLVTDYGASTFGLVMSSLGVGSVVGGIIAIRLRPRYPLRAGALSMTLWALMPLGVALGLPAPLVAGCYAVSGVGSAFWIVMFHTSVQTHIPQDVLGRVHAYDAAGSLVMKPVGQAVAGPLAVVAGTVPLLWVSASMALVACALLLMIPAVRGLKRVERMER
ncbi:putative integral membrane efflux protein [Streptomyces himastatinicus ATCC 53653]|uniref:Putative integral membrane efflux protein n=2 Tax=Streptomyces violaceusniger group TaxID=2839105 RepID=D9WWF6_9ACTN|nr:putative integral membrane efflux protein [Streptomyces himastatinicus ATCC 53653]